MTLRERLAEWLWSAHDWAMGNLPWDRGGDPSRLAIWLLELTDWVQGEGPGPLARLTPEELAESARWRAMTPAERAAETEAEGGVY